MKVYYENDANLELLRNKRIAVLGFGSQGHAHALNLKDSGMNVKVGLRDGSSSWEKAEKLGVEVDTIENVSKWANVIMMLLPDQYQKSVFENEVKHSLEEGDTLAFAHGFNIHYKSIEPPQYVNVIMIAPKSPGHLVRRMFTEGNGVPCLIAVNQDFTGNAKDLALAWAKGLGGTKAGVIETTFKDETETDLFGEQAVLCGGIAELIKAGFETLTEAGYPPEMAYFECMHEMKLIVDLFYEGGLTKMNYSVSDTAEYGGYTRGPRVVNSTAKEAMKKVLKEVQDGSFAKEFIEEYNGSREKMNSLRKLNAEHPIEKTGKVLREMMSWINNAKRVDEV